MPVTNGISAHQDSCHVPLFVVYPYTPPGTSDGTFFDHYSITKTVADLFGLPYPGHAGDAQTASLVGHFSIPAPSGMPSPSPSPSSSSPSPSPVAVLVALAVTVADRHGVPRDPGRRDGVLRECLG